MVFQDSDLPLSDHEQVIFDAVIAALQPATVARQHPLAKMTPKERNEKIIWADTLRAKKAAQEEAHNQQLANHQPTRSDASHFQCFNRVSFTPHYGVFSTHPDDTIKFREAVYSHFALPPPTRCPPKRVALLYRHNRGILNKDEIRTMLKKEFDLDMEFVTIDENSSSETQVSLFASTGLMLSSHSSQMINVLFSPPGAAMVEIAPEFYNADFAEYANGMGIFFQYALGHNAR